MSSALLDAGDKLTVGHEAAFDLGHHHSWLEDQGSVSFLASQVAGVATELAQADAAPIVQLDEHRLYRVGRSWSITHRPGLYGLGDEASGSLARRIEDWLDRLEQDPGAAIVRQRRPAEAGVWAITVRQIAGDDWAIVWDSDGADIDVRHIGPASFA